jgi:membrane-anchored protein YejM (alkaline phosphatase superfamily)
MRTLLSSAALFVLVGCASQGDVIEIQSKQTTMSGELGMMKRDTKAALDQMDEIQRQIQRTLKASDEKLNRILEALRERRELAPSLTPGPLPLPTP